MLPRRRRVVLFIDAHEHGGHLRARGIAHRQQITVLVTEQDAVRTGKFHRRLIPGAGRCRLGAGLRAGFGAGFDRGCRLRRGDGRLCRRCRGLHSVRFCSGDRRGGQRQHADKHEQQGQKAFAHGFLLHCFLRISTVFIITEGCDFSTVFAEISNYLSLLCHRRKKSSAASQDCAAQLVKEPRRVCARRRKESSIIFFGDMCGEENTSRPANVRAVRRKRAARALQSGRRPLCQKSSAFLTVLSAASQDCA